MSVISVIIPVYNKEKYIAKCIDSVLSQTFSDFELVLIDDGSKDNSGKILDEYASKDSRVKVFHIENGGVMAARNLGVNKSVGEYITFIDGDDTVEKTLLETLLTTLEQNNCDIAHCNYSNVVGSEKTPVSNSGEVLVQSGEEAIEYLLLGKRYIVGLFPKLYKKQLFENIPEYTGIKINEDYLINFMLFQKAKKIVFKDLALYNYYAYDDSTTHTANPVNSWSDIQKVAKIVLEKSQGKTYETYSKYRYEKTFIELYGAMLLDKSVEKTEKKQCLTKLKEIYKGENSFSKNDRLKVRIYRYLPFAYKLGFKVFDKVRKKQLDPEM